MLDKLQNFEDRYQQLKTLQYADETTNDMEKMIAVSKEISGLEKVHELYTRYKSATDQIAEAKEILTSWDSEMADLAQMQLDENESLLPQLDEEVKIALLPKDPNDDKDIFIEIRPAAGWDESALFGWELLRMYLRYAERKGWKSEIVENQVSDIGWIKFAVIKIAWESVYSKMKFESWVHRVQRIPETESNGRIHTSTVTVAVLPEVDDVQVDMKMEDIEMDTFAASSAWGQNANKNQTWVRIHHKPTGIIVTIADSKSQLQNKEKAFKVLKSKLFQAEEDKRIAELKADRINQIGSWDRSEKIRTYNFPQDRLTDHRVKLSWSNLPAIMDWDIDEIINNLVIENQTMLLQAAQNK